MKIPFCNSCFKLNWIIVVFVYDYLHSFRQSPRNSSNICERFVQHEWEPTIKKVCIRVEKYSRDGHFYLARAGLGMWVNWFEIWVA